MSKCVNCLKEINEKEVFCLTCHEKVLEYAKQQIVELEEELKNYKLCRCVDCSTEYEKGLETSIDELENENQQLKQQLHDLPKKIVEEIRKWGHKHFNWVGDGTGYDGQDYNECIGFNMAIDQLNEILDTILKKYGGE